MEGRGELRRGASRLNAGFDSLVSNSGYVIAVSGTSVFARRVDTSSQEAWQCIYSAQGSRTAPIFALSSAYPTSAAVGDGTEVSLLGLRNGHTCKALQTRGRRVTALTWSHRIDKLLAVGYLDGIVTVTNLGRDSVSQQTVLQLSKGPVRLLSFCATGEDYLAGITRDNLFVWKCSPSCQRPRAVTLLQQDTTDFFIWHPFIPLRSLTASKSGTITTWDLTSVEKFRDQQFAGSMDGSGIFGLADDNQQFLSPIWRLFLQAGIRQIDWIGEHGLLVLSASGRDINLYDTRSTISSPESIWDFCLSHECLHFRFSDKNEGSIVISSQDGQVEKLFFPPHILEMVEWSDEASCSPVYSTSLPEDEPSRLSTHDDDRLIKPDTSISMQPVPITTLRKQQAARQNLQSSESIASLAALKALPDSPTPTHQMESSARLETSNLSPTLPQSRWSQDLSSSRNQADISSQSHWPSSKQFRRTSMYEGVQTNVQRESSPPGVLQMPSSVSGTDLHQVTSIETLASANHSEHESDSDDDTFGDVLNHSGTLPPGAVNVPLPRSCGAVFAPNGQLITFFPSRPTKVARSRDVIDGVGRPKIAHSSKGDVVFPSFGVLACDHLLSTSDSDPSPMDDTSQKSTVPRFALIPPSFQGLSQWTSTGNEPLSGAKESKVILSVKELGDINVHKRLATAYRFLRAGDSAREICQHNSTVAQEAGLLDIAAVWIALAVLLEDNVPLENVTERADDLDVVGKARKAMSLLPVGRGTGIVDFTAATIFGNPSWSDHVFGGTWLLRRLFNWAIQSADIQMLAMMSAVLLDPSGSSGRCRERGSFLSKLPSFQPFSVLPPPPLQPTLRLLNRRDVSKQPALRPGMGRKLSSHSMLPTKAMLELSAPSSRNPSLPTTPFAESTSSTPPFPFSISARQNTGGSRLSISGSVSPENHRSSFSAAAKYYAQSISDKFASYSTSPPAKKLSVSPGNHYAANNPSSNHLSSSGPSVHTAAGVSSSWGKSVSFASTAKDPPNSSSTGSATARRSVDYGDDISSGEESDRTVEDCESQPQTPRYFAEEIKVTFKHEEAFGDRTWFGGVEEDASRFLPPDLAAKSRFWQMRYAEMLRAWGLTMDAIEMDKIAGMTGVHVSDEIGASRSHRIEKDLHVESGIAGRKTICSVCSCVVEKLEQVCPTCLHANHLACLQGFIGDADGDWQQFECPSGCGCVCLVEHWDAPGGDEDNLSDTGSAN